jgi:hypothetical protein
MKGRTHVNEWDPIQAVLEGDEAAVIAKQVAPAGPIGKLVMSCNATANNLLGFVLDMSYDEVTIVTCDAWKRKCGGVPKNSFVIIRLNPLVARLAPEERPRPALILARILEPVATPLTTEVQQTIFTIHKVPGSRRSVYECRIAMGSPEGRYSRHLL